MSDEYTGRARRRASTPTRLGDVLAGLKGPAGPIRTAFHIEALQRRWRSLVGEALAGRSEPVWLTQGQLTVHVANSVWLNELNFTRADLLARLRDQHPDLGVTDLLFKVGPLQPAPTDED